MRSFYRLELIRIFKGSKFVLINDSKLGNIDGSKGENVADNMTGVKEHALKCFALYGGQYICRMYDNFVK